MSLNQPTIQDQVLFVDDDPDTRRLVSELFRTKLGIVVTLADSAKEAIDLLGEQNFTLVVSDYEMPGARGIEVVSFMARERMVTPFLFYTSSNISSHELQKLDYPIVVIQKPYFEGLLSMAAKMLRPHWGRMTVSQKIERYGYDPDSIEGALKINRRVGDLFKRLREKSGKTIEEVEQASGVSATEMKAWESGYLSPTETCFYNAVSILGDQAMFEASEFLSHLQDEAQRKIAELKDENSPDDPSSTDS